MSNGLTTDREVIQEGRKNTLKDNEDTGLKVEVSLREKIINQLVDILEEKNIAEKISNVWSQANNDRVEWIEKQTMFLKFLDEFMDPLYESSTDWGSVLHLPVVLTVCKTYHARMYAALMSIDPPFTVMPRQEANVDRAKTIQELIRYTLKDWINEYQGIADVVDDWLWEWVTTGSSILKARWERKFVSFMDVEEQQIPQIKLEVDPETGQMRPVQSFKTVEKEVKRTIVSCDGPVCEKPNIEDIVIVGGNGDPDRADYVIEQVPLTASELWTLADRKVFRREVVEEMINAGNDSVYNAASGELKQERKEHQGLANVDAPYDLDRYRVLECYLSVDVDGSGINSQIVCWVAAKTRKILRATYLHRVMKSGLRPYFKIDFHRRKGVEYGVGLIEMLYSLAKEIDAMHNMKIDTGILTSLPWGFYRPAPSMPEEKLEIEPGTMIPVDNPSQDVYFPNLGNRVSFGFQEEAALQQQIERLTSISDISLGVIGGQGAARTATGARALLGESNANLDIYIQRMNRGWKKFLIYLFNMLQQHIPNDFQFRVLGDDGDSYWAKVDSREEIKGMYDFELEPNSINSNKQVQMEVANQVYQLTSNPLDMQLGLVSPANRYEAIKNLMQVNGIKAVSKFLTKPQNVMRVFSPEEVANRVLHGIDVHLDPTQDLDGIVNYIQHIMDNDELLGQFGQHEVAALVSKMQEAAAIKQAMDQMAAQQANVQQQQINAQSGAPQQTSVPVQQAQAPANTGQNGAQ